MPILPPNFGTIGNAQLPAYLAVSPCGEPGEGRRAVPALMTFKSTGTCFQLNAQSGNRGGGWLASVRGLWIDNSTNAAALYINVADTNQMIVVPAFSQGYRNIITGTQTLFIFSTPQNVSANARVILLNYHVEDDMQNCNPFTGVGVCSQVSTQTFSGPIPNNPAGLRCFNGVQNYQLCIQSFRIYALSAIWQANNGNANFLFTGDNVLGSFYYFAYQTPSNATTVADGHLMVAEYQWNMVFPPFEGFILSSAGGINITSNGMIAVWQYGYMYSDAQGIGGFQPL